MRRSLRSPLPTLLAATVVLGAAQLGTGVAAGASASGSAPDGPVLSAFTAPAAADGRDRPVAAVVAARAATARAAAEAAAAQAAAEADRVAAAQAAEAARAAADAERAVAEQAAAQAAAAASACSGPGWEQRRGERALASLGPGALASGWRVAFSGARSSYLGLAHLDRELVEVFVRSCERQSDELLRHVLAHELGHAFDTARLDDATRAAWKAARGIPASTPWYGCSGCTDFATPAGDFAEVYAQWLRGAAQNRSELAGDLGPAELAALAARFFG